MGPRIECYNMSLVKNALLAAKTMPKFVWLAAIIVPGGFTVLGAWLSMKSVYDTAKNRRKND